MGMGSQRGCHPGWKGMAVLGVLIMNTGTPDEPTPEAIRPYLKQFLSDRNLIDMPPAVWQPILNLFILPNRPKKTAPLYREIWTPEGSPFIIDSLHQRDALEARLRDLTSEPVTVQIGMRYGNPSIESALAKLRDAGAERIVALPLYPQYTKSCAGTCFQEFDRAFQRVYGYALEDAGVQGNASDGGDAALVSGLGASRASALRATAAAPRVVRIGHYWDAPGYLKALAASIRRAWEYVPGSKLVVSFHSIPVSHAQAGDPYPEQTRATAHALADELEIPRDDVQLAYQSRFDSRAWVGPFLEGELSRFAKERVQNIAVVCPGFSVDCLETAHEVRDQAARHFAEECRRFGNEGARFTYVPALGADPAFIEALAHAVARSAC